MSVSELNRITQILEDAIANRQQLAIGQSIAAIVRGQTGLFLAGNKTISAIATNYCYGNCLLAKVDGKWYAINPDDHRRVVSGGVDRLFQRKKSNSALPTISIALAPTITPPVIPGSIRRGSSDLLIRISIDEAQDEPTPFVLAVDPDSTATSEDYTLLAGREIPAGSLFVDKYVRAPFIPCFGEDKLLLLKLQPASNSLIEYEIGDSELAVTITPGHFGYSIHVSTDRGIFVQWSTVTTRSDVIYTYQEILNYNILWRATVQAAVLNTGAPGTSYSSFYYTVTPSFDLFPPQPEFAANNLGIGTGYSQINPNYQPNNVVNYLQVGAPAVGVNYAQLYYYYNNNYASIAYYNRGDGTIDSSLPTNFYRIDYMVFE